MAQRMILQEQLNYNMVCPVYSPCGYVTFYPGAGHLTTHYLPYDYLKLYIVCTILAHGFLRILYPFLVPSELHKYHHEVKFTQINNSNDMSQ